MTRTMRLVDGMTYKEVIRLVGEGSEAWNLARAVTALQRACEVQVATDARGGENWPISPEISQRSAAAIETMRVGRAHGQLELSAMVRLLDRVDRSWRT